MVKAAEYWNCNDAVIVWNVVPFDLILNPSECELRNSWPKTRVRSSPVVMSRPFCRRMLCDVKVQDSTTSDFHDDKYIHQTERRRCHHEEIGSHDCERTSSIAETDLPAVSGSSACNALPFEVKSECPSSKEVHRQSVLHPN